MDSFFNKNVETIKYATSTDKRNVVTFSSNGSNDETTMLIDGAQLQMQRPATVQRFLNADPALIVGRPSGTLTLSGLFGTTDQIKNIIGDPKNPCKLPRTITLQAGVLQVCNNSGTGPDAGGAKETITLFGCVCQGFQVQVQLQQQDGNVLQQGSATFTVTDCGI